MYKVLLYYKYTKVENPTDAVKKQKEFCNEHGLVGRILIATEGINGTICGTEESCKKYKEFMNSTGFFNDISYKESLSSFICFSKLQVKLKKEIVRLDNTDLTINDAAPRISPEEAHRLLSQNNPNLVILDTRNDYEWKVGVFKNATTLPIKTFREFKKCIDERKDLLKDKDILMYCTGDVRCELSSAYVKKLGIAKSVCHIENGIHAYVEKYPNGFFRGSNYVFDDRITIRINDDILAECECCQIPCDLYNNCLNALCNKHYICCDTCLKSFNSCCSKECMKKIEENSVPKRPKLYYRDKLHAAHQN